MSNSKNIMSEQQSSQPYRSLREWDERDITKMHREAREEKEGIARRAILGGILGGAVVGGLASLFGNGPINQVIDYIEEEHWAHTPTYVQPYTLDPKDPYYHNKTWRPNALVFTGGLGERSVFKSADAAREYDAIPYPDDWLIGTTQYSPQGPTAGSVAQAVKDFTSKYNPLSMGFSGRSTGGLLNVAGVTGAARRVDTFMLVSSPSDIEDVKHSDFAQLQTAIGDGNNYINSMQYVTLSNFTSHVFEEEGPQQLPVQALNAVRQMWRSEMPTGLRKTVAAIEHMDKDEWLPGIKRYMSSETLALYVMSEFPVTDIVVDDIQAFHKFEEYFAQAGVKLLPVRYAAPGHALIKEAMEVAAPFIRGRLELVDVDGLALQRRHMGMINASEDLQQPDLLIPGGERRQRITTRHGQLIP